MRVFLETERLVLRQFTEDDVDLLVELDGDPDVMHFVTGGRPTPRDEIETEVLPAFLDYYERSDGYGFWAAIEKSSGRFLGWFHFRPAQDAPPNEVELGYRLHKAAWGNGYATEGSRALIDKGFAEHGVERSPSALPPRCQRQFRGRRRDRPRSRAAMRARRPRRTGRPPRRPSNPPIPAAPRSRVARASRSDRASRLSDPAARRDAIGASEPRRRS